MDSNSSTIKRKVKKVQTVKEIHTGTSLTTVTTSKETITTTEVKFITPPQHQRTPFIFSPPCDPTSSSSSTISLDLPRNIRNMSLDEIISQSESTPISTTKRSYFTAFPTSPVASVTSVRDTSKFPRKIIDFKAREAIIRDKYSNLNESIRTPKQWCPSCEMYSIENSICLICHFNQLTDCPECWQSDSLNMTSEGGVQTGLRQCTVCEWMDSEDGELIHKFGDNPLDQYDKTEPEEQRVNSSEQWTNNRDTNDQHYATEKMVEAILDDEKKSERLDLMNSNQERMEDAAYTDFMMKLRGEIAKLHAAFSSDQTPLPSMVVIMLNLSSYIKPWYQTYYAVSHQIKKEKMAVINRKYTLLDHNYLNQIDYSLFTHKIHTTRFGEALAVMVDKLEKHPVEEEYTEELAAFKKFYTYSLFLQDLRRDKMKEINAIDNSGGKTTPLRNIAAALFLTFGKDGKYPNLCFSQEYFTSVYKNRLGSKHGFMGPNELIRLMKQIDPDYSIHIDSTPESTSLLKMVVSVWTDLAYKSNPGLIDFKEQLDNRINRQLQLVLQQMKEEPTRFDRSTIDSLAVAIFFLSADGIPYTNTLTTDKKSGPKKWTQKNVVDLFGCSMPRFKANLSKINYAVGYEVGSVKTNHFQNRATSSSTSLVSQ